jgi:hypothetical protein
MTRKRTAAEITEIADGWTKEDMAYWGIPWPPPKDWKFRLLNSEYRRPEDDAFDQTDR